MMLTSTRWNALKLSAEPGFLRCIPRFYEQSRRGVSDLADRQKAFEAKYADKLHERVKREGVTDLNELRRKISAQKPPPDPVVPKQSSLRSTKEIPNKALKTLIRKDSSPVKPLTDLMDIKKLLINKHSAEEISTLWTTYHATRSQGTGRGYISATVPLTTYLKMSSVAIKYSSFLLPLPRPQRGTAVQDQAHEFYFLQWGFHEAPSHPSWTPTLPLEDKPTSAPLGSPLNPAYSTILFTPLQEYKLRQTFAQPYLVVTHYTDLATTHGIVLMRGELTPSPSSREKYLLSQADAQLLAMGVQQFYLAGDDKSTRRAQLLRKFHESPAEFRWEELLVFADSMM